MRIPMTRSPVTFLRSFLSVAAIAGCLASTPARAQIHVQIFPPSSFVAVNTPVYYEGHATYWYGNQWYYRDGRQWRAYHQEPVYLHEYRGRHMAAQYHYEPSRHGGYRQDEHHQPGYQHQQGYPHSNGHDDSDRH
jgi:hypothetical protein